MPVHGAEAPFAVLPALEAGLNGKCSRPVLPPQVGSHALARGSAGVADCRQRDVVTAPGTDVASSPAPISHAHTAAHEADSSGARGAGLVDARESLCNDRCAGPAYDVSLPRERITQLHGILLDLDPNLYRQGNSFFPPAEDPKTFYPSSHAILDRHPLTRHAEVRCSGSGLHVLIWLQPAVELKTAADQERWEAIVRAVQCSLPVDPDAPGLTALTRPVGAINSKTGASVVVLKEGAPVDPALVVDFVGRLNAAPFKEIAQPLLNAESVSPCPVCQAVGSRLDVLDRVGKCYGSCGTITLDRLYDLILKPYGRRMASEPDILDEADGDPITDGDEPLEGPVRDLMSSAAAHTSHAAKMG
jgi:hypothetical protein